MFNRCRVSNTLSWSLCGEKLKRAAWQTSGKQRARDARCGVSISSFDTASVKAVVTLSKLTCAQRHRLPVLTSRSSDGQTWQSMTLNRPWCHKWGRGGGGQPSGLSQMRSLIQGPFTAYSSTDQVLWVHGVAWRSQRSDVVVMADVFSSNLDDNTSTITTGRNPRKAWHSLGWTEICTASGAAHFNQGSAKLLLLSTGGETGADRGFEPRLPST